MRLIKIAVSCLAAGPAGRAGLRPQHGRLSLGEAAHRPYRADARSLQALGLTHITRHGYTRGQKKDPDPTFPPGLTDVVPYDAGHTLLVRGTAAGVASFRQRVAAADVPDPRWQLSLTLLRKDGDDYRVLAGPQHGDRRGQPLAVAFDTDGQFPQYQVRVRVNRDGSLAVTCWTALSLAPPSTGATTVLVPTQVWTPPLTKDVRRRRHADL